MPQNIDLPVVFLMGPTASGKTGLAVELVQRLPMDIISVDSAMVYRGMDIGTAKPGRETLERAPHRLIDFLDPAQSYSAARFAEDARREIEAIHTRGRIPLLVGGTMLYFSALYRGLSDLPNADAGVRSALDQEAVEKGWPALHARLAEKDPETAQRIHPNDAQRIQRALEVIELTGRGLSEHDAPASDFPWPCLRMVVCPQERKLLHRQIEQRFQAMMAQGFLEEVQTLHQRPELNPDLPSMRCVGYRQLWQYLDGAWSLEEAIQRGIAASRQLAKRQLTWLRSETSGNTGGAGNRDALPEWLDALSPNLLDQALNLLLQRKLLKNIDGFAGLL